MNGPRISLGGAGDSDISVPTMFACVIFTPATVAPVVGLIASHSTVHDPLRTSPDGMVMSIGSAIARYPTLSIQKIGTSGSWLGAVRSMPDCCASTNCT